LRICNNAATRGSRREPTLAVNHHLFTTRADAMAEEKKPLYLEPTKSAFTLLEEFKNFAFKGNVIDLAVGVIIGAAFGKIVDSLVKQIIMPLIAVITPGKQTYVEWKAVVNGKEVPYGIFLGDVVNFLIIALVLFIFIVKFLGWIMKSKKQEAAAPPPPNKQEVLLTEIRDLLKQRPA
jgi:large conductance mechanosensitive channel